MKQAIFILSLVGSGLAVSAQDSSQVSGQNNTQMNNSSQMNTTSQMSTTTSMNSMDAGRSAARDMKADVSPASLPVMQSYVPSDVMSKLTGSYGKALYAVTMVKSATGENAYQAT